MFEKIKKSRTSNRQWNAVPDPIGDTCDREFTTAANHMYGCCQKCSRDDVAHDEQDHQFILGCAVAPALCSRRMGLSVATGEL